MAYTVNFGAASLRGYTDGSPVRVDGLSLPTGRQMANGSRACIITGIGAYVAGNGATRAIALQLGSSVTPWFNVGASNTGQWTGVQGSSGWLVQGGTAQLQVHMRGSIFFLRGGPGSTYSSYGTRWDGGIAGAYQYIQAPSEPRNARLVPHPTESGRVDIHWDGVADDGQSGITAYEVYNPQGQRVLEIHGGARSAPIYGLTPGVSHTFYVRARNWVTEAAGTQSLNSNAATGIAPGVPTAPTGLSAQPSSSVSGRIDLAWSAPTNTGPITGYDVLRDGSVIGTTPSETRSFASTGLAVGQPYTFTVRARNAYSEANNKTGPLSGPASADAPGVPSAPRNLASSANMLVSGRIDLTWDAPANVANGLTSYTIHYANGAQIATVDDSVRSYAVTGLTPGTTQSFYVRARNSFAEANNTYSSNSNTTTTMAPGLPGAPRSLTATVSTSVFGRITLDWEAPLDTAGGITRYNIYANGVMIGTSTVPSFVANDLTTATSYSFTVGARNAFADAVTPPRVGPLSSPSVAVAPGPPSAPRNLTAVAHETTAGAVILNWVAPATTSGVITGYTIYRSDGLVLGSVTGTATTYTVTGLIPAERYSFFVRARNAIADVVGTFSANSNTASVQALGDPGIPTNLSAVASTTIAGRVTLTWVAPSGPVTGYNVYQSTGQLLAKLGPVTSFVQDFLVSGNSYGYFVRARNAVTDANNVDGPSSLGVSVVAKGSTTQAVAPSTVSNLTNTILSGDYTITGATSDTISYLRLSDIPVPPSSVPIGTATVEDKTNINLNGTYAISTPSATTISYAKTGTAIPVNTPAFGGILTDNTNTIFNGTYTLTEAVALDRTISYSRIGSNVSSRAASGSATNLTNTTYNGAGKEITAVSEDTISYTLVHSDLSETAATGVVRNNTNEDVFNGTHTVTGVPAHNVFTYVPSVTGSYGSMDAAVLFPFGDASRVNSISSLEIKYRSGWLG